MNLRLLVVVCAAISAVACSSNEAPPAPAATAVEKPAAAAAKDAPGKADGAPLTLLLTSDNVGEIAPCGCSGFPAGGLARRATIVEANRSAGPTFVLDGGDALFVDVKAPDEQALERASLILSTMGQIGTAAMAVGERDLVGGVDWLVREAKAAGVAVLAANLVAADGKRPFEAARIVSTGGYRVGVIGVWAAGELPATLQASDPMVAVEDEATRLRKEGVDLVVVLAHGPMKATNEIATVSGVDFLLPSHQHSQTLPFQRAKEGAWVLGADSRGRTVLKVEVHPDGEGPLVDMGASARTHKERVYMEGRVAEARDRLKTIEPEKKAAFTRMLERLEERLAALDKELSLPADDKGRRFALEEIRLGDAVDGGGPIEARVAAFEKSWGVASAEK